MRLICIKNTYTLPNNYGCYEHPHYGLTVGKIYTGIIIQRDSRLPRFLIFTDDNKWQEYEIDLFMPKESLTYDSILDGIRILWNRISIWSYTFKSYIKRT